MIDCSFESCNIWKGFYLVTKLVQKEAEDCHGILHKGVWRSEVSEAGPLQKVSKMGTNNHTKSAEYYGSMFAKFTKLYFVE